MNAAGLIYDTVGAVENAVTRGLRRISWLIDDVRGAWSAMTAIPWTADPEPWVSDGYQPPGLERILPDRALRAADTRVDRATPDELDRLLDEILNDGGEAA